jgi:hypothetical protein
MWYFELTDNGSDVLFNSLLLFHWPVLSCDYDHNIDVHTCLI